jgi:hypothetical protein
MNDIPPDTYKDPAMIELVRCCIGDVTLAVVTPANIDESFVGLKNRLNEFRTDKLPDIELVILCPNDQKDFRGHRPDNRQLAEVLNSKIIQQDSPKVRPKTISETTQYFDRLLSDSGIAPWLDNINVSDTQFSMVQLEMGFLLFRPNSCQGLVVLDVNWPFTRHDQPALLLPHIHLSKINGVFATLSLYLAERGGAIVHGTGIEHWEKGFLFLAPSGGGKTTLSVQSLPGTVLADDGLIVREDSAGYALYPTPFRQRPGGATRQWDWHRSPAPLRAVFLLEKGMENAVRPIPRSEALGRLMNSYTHFFSLMNTQQAVAIFDFWRRLTVRIPVNRLTFRMGTDFWPLIYNFCKMEKTDEDQKRKHSMACSV